MKSNEMMVCAPRDQTVIVSHNNHQHHYIHPRKDFINHFNNQKSHQKDHQKDHQTPSSPSSMSISNNQSSINQSSKPKHSFSIDALVGNNNTTKHHVDDSKNDSDVHYKNFNTKNVANNNIRQHDDMTSSSSIPLKEKQEIKQVKSDSNNLSSNRSSSSSNSHSNRSFSSPKTSPESSPSVSPSNFSDKNNKHFNVNQNVNNIQITKRFSPERTSQFNDIHSLNQQMFSPQNQRHLNESLFHRFYSHNSSHNPFVPSHLPPGHPAAHPSGHSIHNSIPSLSMVPMARPSQIPSHHLGHPTSLPPGHPGHGLPPPGHPLGPEYFHNHAAAGPFHPSFVSPYLRQGLLHPHLHGKNTKKI